MKQCGAPHVNLNLELWTVAEIAGFILSLASRQTEHIPRHLIPSSFTIVRKLLVFNPHPLLSCSRSMSIELSTINLSSWIWPYHSHSQTMQVQTSSTIYINKLINLKNFYSLRQKYQVKCQGHPSHGTRDTAENVHGTSSIGCIVIDTTILIILRLKRNFAECDVQYNPSNTRLYPVKKAQGSSNKETYVTDRSQLNLHTFKYMSVVCR